MKGFDLAGALRENPDLAAENPDLAAGLRSPGKPSKYGNVRTEVDGITFDSAREAREYAILKLLAQSGDITDLVLQPRFPLQDGNTDAVTGLQRRPVTYVADFAYTDRQGRRVVVDVKGFRTKEYRIKVKLFRERYPELIFEERR